MKINKQFAMIYGFLAVILLWYLLSVILGNKLIPFPHTVAGNLFHLMLHGQLIFHSLASLWRLSFGITAATILGVPLGVAMGINKRLDSVVSPIVYILYPLPKIAFLPIFMLLFGLGNLSKIILLISIIFFQIILASRDGVKEIPQEYHFAAKTLHLNRNTRFFKLYLPSTLSRLFSALRISVGIGIAVLFFAENYATTYGLGYFIMNNWIMINYPDMFAGIIALGITAAFVLFFIDRLEFLLCPWRKTSDEQL